MKIMETQVSKRVHSLTLSDGWYTQAGRVTLQELCRVNFPDSDAADDVRWATITFKLYK
jgi:hypothetical protein